MLIRPKEILEKAAVAGEDRAFSTILELTEKFHNADREKSGLIEAQTFSNIVSQVDLGLTYSEAQRLSKYIESQMSPGFVDYILFLKHIKGPDMNLKRRELIYDMFSRLNFKDPNSVDLRLMGDIFFGKNHYSVKAGRKPASKVEEEFKRAISIFIRLFNQGSAMVNFEGFKRLWDYVSPTIGPDNHFEFISINCFWFSKLPRRDNYNKPEVDRFERSAILKKDIPFDRTKKPDPAQLDYLLGEVSENLSTLGPVAFFTLYKSLRNNDYDRDGKVSGKEFFKSFYDNQSTLPQDLLVGVFKFFDRDGKGLVGIPHFMCSLVPELNQKRQAVVTDLFNALTSNIHPELIPLSQLRKFHYPRGHPDFFRGLKSDKELAEEFEFMLTTFLSLSGGIHELIPREILNQFFDLLSASYSDDQEFCDIVICSFRLDRISAASRRHSSHLYEPQDFSRSAFRPRKPSNQRTEQRELRASHHLEDNRFDPNITQESPKIAVSVPRMSKTTQQPSNLAQSKPAGYERSLSPVPKNFQPKDHRYGKSSEKKKSPHEDSEEHTFDHTHPYQRINRYTLQYDKANRSNSPMHATATKSNQDLMAQGRTSSPTPNRLQTDNKEAKLSSPQAKPQASELSGNRFEHTHPYQRINRYTEHLERNKSSPKTQQANQDTQLRANSPLPPAKSAWDAYRKSILTDMKKFGSNFFDLELAYSREENQRTRLINRSTFQKGLVDSGVRFSATDFERLYQLVSEGQPNINYLTFVARLRGELPAQVAQAIETLFRKLDKQRTNQIQVDELVAKFRPEKVNGYKSQHHGKQMANNLRRDLDLFGKIGVDETLSGI